MPEVTQFTWPSLEELNFKTITDGLGTVLYEYPFNVPGYYALILRSLTVLEGLALSTDPKFKVLGKAYPYMVWRCKLPLCKPGGDR
jgi:aarF domain-containing kinase